MSQPQMSQINQMSQMKATPIVRGIEDTGCRNGVQHQCDHNETHQTSKLEERIRDLPVTPTKPLAHSEHHHIHCEFCGHYTIIHGNHFDYLHDAELHCVSSSGIVFQHKLEASDINPTACRPLLQYPWHANGPPTSDSVLNNSKESNFDYEGEGGGAPEDIEKVHEAWNRYSERGSRETRSFGSMAVIHHFYPIRTNA